MPLDVLHSVLDTLSRTRHLRLSQLKFGRSSLMPWCNKCRPWPPLSKACNPGASRQHRSLQPQFSRCLLQADSLFEVRTLKFRPPSGESIRLGVLVAGHNHQRLSRSQGNLYRSGPPRRSPRMMSSTRRSRSWSARFRHSMEGGRDAMVTLSSPRSPPSPNRLKMSRSRQGSRCPRWSLTTAGLTPLTT